MTRGDRHAVDLVAKVRFRGELSCFLIHVEHQAQPQSEFGRRMFAYLPAPPLGEVWLAGLSNCGVFLRPAQPAGA